MANKIIFIAGPSASGKSRYAEHLNDQFHMPVICKDNVKELLYEGTGFSPVSIEAVQKYGSCAYDLLFYFAECLMKCGTDLALESNFTPFSQKTILPLLDTYGYDSFTVLFDAPSPILHKRFTRRDHSGMRHPGHGTGLYDDYETFHKNAEKARQFHSGTEKLTVDTSDWSRVDYCVIDRQIALFLKIQ